MTIKYKLIEMYRKNEIISVCLYSQEQYNKGYRDTLEFKIEGKYYPLKPIQKDYKNYSHSICDDCLKIYAPKIYKRKNEKFN